jgi:hypothetical protein
MSQNPASTTEVLIGSTVDIVISLGKPIIDDFNDNMRGAIWRLFSSDGNNTWVIEDANRLNTRANGGIVNLTSSCVGLWAMNDNAADLTVIDSSGNGNDGTAVQNTDLLHTTGKIDGALTFNGTSDYVDIGNLIGTSTYTKAAWVRRSASAGNIYDNIISGDAGHAFWAPNASAYPWEYKLSAGHDSNWDIVQDDVPLLVDTWYFVAVTYDSAVDSGTMILYKNGVEVSGPKAVATGVATPTLSGTPTTYIGRYSDDYSFNGSIDNVMIFDRALSADEIEILYSEGNGTETLPSDHDFAAYLANGWSIDAAEDFEVKADFHYSSISQRDGWVGITIENDDVYAALSVGSDSGAAYYYADTNSISEQSSRVSDDGTLYVSYDSTLDELYLSYTGYGVSDAWQTISGMLQSSGSVSVSIGGGSDNVELVLGNAYLDNFEVTTASLLGWPPATDLDEDGLIGLGDLVILCSGWLQPGPADFDLSGNTDLNDFAELESAW